MSIVLGYIGHAPQAIRVLSRGVRLVEELYVTLLLLLLSFSLEDAESWEQAALARSWRLRGWGLTLEGVLIAYLLFAYDSHASEVVWFYENEFNVGTAGVEAKTLRACWSLVYLSWNLQNNLIELIKVVSLQYFVNPIMNVYEKLRIRWCPLWLCLLLALGQFPFNVFHNLDVNEDPGFILNTHMTVSKEGLLRDSLLFNQLQLLLRGWVGLLLLLTGVKGLSIGLRVSGLLLLLYVVSVDAFEFLDDVLCHVEGLLVGILQLLTLLLREASVILYLLKLLQHLHAILGLLKVHT